MNGQVSARDLHQELAFPPGATCQVCDRRPMVVARVFLSVKDMRARDPLFDALCNRDPASINAMLVMFRGGDGKPSPHVRLTTVYACSEHTSEMEKVLARSTPSYAVVEINRGPKENPTVGWGTVPT
jgi:hypothetical protein